MAFETAPTKPKSSPRPPAKTRSEVVTPGLQQAVALRVVMDRLKALSSEADTRVKWLALQTILAQGCATGQRPESFVAQEGMAAAIMALKVRPVTSSLSEEEAAALDAAQVAYETVEERSETLAFNPAYMRNTRLMAKVEEALKAVPGLPPDFILREPAKTRRVVSQEALEGLFKLPPEQAAPLLRIMSSIQMTPLAEDRPLADYIAVVVDALTPVPALPAEPTDAPPPLLIRPPRRTGRTQVVRREGKLVRRKTA